MLGNQDAFFYFFWVQSIHVDPELHGGGREASMPFPCQGIAVDHSHHLALQLISGVSIASNASFVFPAPEGIGASRDYSLYIKLVLALYEATGASYSCS